MKQSTTCLRLEILPAILALCLYAVVQAQDTADNHELALEVSNGDARPWQIPAFNGGSSEGTNFRRLKSWKSSSGEPPVVNIIFKIGRDADIVIAYLAVRLANEKAVLVGSYRLHEGETVATEALSKFGLEPLVLKVVKAKPSFNKPPPPIEPLLENKTKAVAVVDFYREAPPSESFRLTLRNVSTKNIMALDLFMPSPNGNGGGGQRPQGDKEHLVMRPGRTSDYHIGVARAGRMTPNGYVPDPEVQRTIIIRTVVFDDGTYDGLVEPAAEIEAHRRGLNIQRTRILRLLQEAQEKADRNVPTSLNDLKEHAFALEKTTDASVTVELLALFPSLGKKSKDWLLQNVNDGLRDGKLELLNYINDFEYRQLQSGTHITLAEWLEQTKANYEKLTHSSDVH